MTLPKEARSILVTGGSRGIGLATAQAFADAGEKVAVTYRSHPPQDDRLLAIQCDVRDPEDVERAFKEVEVTHGPVEVLVANAGVIADGLLITMSEDDFDTVLDTNLKGVFRVVKRALKPMLKARSGRIIAISSVGGAMGVAGQANYAASKAGLEGFIRSVALEYGERGITANTVAPGIVTTDMLDSLPRERREELVRRTPVGRPGQPREIAAAVQFFAGNAFANGAYLAVDGGMAMGH
ncbi:MULTISPECIES: 3-oxoacyl-ACP reductase family protein [Streptomyces]|uniref:3-oxoacyl-ACP reductase family protein n=1 Tax=Streptomyces TaxID=1883 RepID=UPI0004CCBE70|nr:MULTISPECIES: 3-oxoacyl-ACP reductase family protein [Streptomyces]KOT62941.1 3-oxoacyl-ACP reductase [Streptomyces rimosus subsp. rimosus]